MKYRAVVPALMMCIATQSGAQATHLPATPASTPPPKGPPSFFVTSNGLGKGGDLGGLAGADRHCQALATAAGYGNRTWRAYLSVQPTRRHGPVNARDRIGKGPWFNVEGFRIAAGLSDLHGDTAEAARNGNLIAHATALTEKGEVIAGEGESPKFHDILTGSRSDGRAYLDSVDHTCSNWTQGGPDGSAQVGHSDRNTRRTSISWNSAHETLGCSPEKLAASGGSGLFYCFAADTPDSG